MYVRTTYVFVFSSQLIDIVLLGMYVRTYYVCIRVFKSTYRFCIIKYVCKLCIFVLLSAVISYLLFFTTLKTFLNLQFLNQDYNHY
jgi:hypothetical protein